MMPLARIVNQRLVARLTQQQIEALLRCEAVADAVDRLVNRSQREILGWLASSNESFSVRQRQVAGILQSLLPGVTSLLDESFGKVATWSHNATSRVLAETVPRPWLRAVQPVVIAAGEAEIVLPPNVIATTDAEPVAGKRMSERQWLAFTRQWVFQAPSANRTNEIIRQPVNGVAWPQRVASLSKLIGDPEQLAFLLTTGYADAQNVQAISQRVEQLTQGVKSSARRIARTEGLRIAEGVQQESYSQLGELLQGQQIIATLDEHTRPHHAARNGRVYYADGRRTPTLREMPQLPDEPNCILPGQLVAGDVLAASKAFYSGEVLEISTSRGHRLRVTPNHPVMTPSGFIPAKMIAKGDYVLSNDGRKPRLIVMSDNKKSCPPTIENVFSAIRETGSTAIREPAPLHFHGDAIAFQGNVEVVAPEWVLRNPVNPDVKESLQDGLLSRAVVDTATEASQGPLGLTLQGIDISATCIPCSGALPSHVAAGSNGLPFDSLGLGSTPIDCTVLDQLPNETPRTPFAVAQASASHPQFVSQLIHGFSGVVSIDEVVDVVKSQYSGHVYDLQTVNEWYFAGGIIVHNCRCFRVPVLRPPEEFVTDPAVRAEFANAAGDSVADPAVYTQWFQQADVSRRKIAVGSRRYETVRKRLDGSREPEWTDFIDPEGKLLSPEVLSRETQLDQVSRKSAVGTAIQQRQELLRQVQQMGFVSKQADTSGFLLDDPQSFPLVNASRRTQPISNAVAGHVQALPEAMQTAVKLYTGDEYYDLNVALRSGEQLTADQTVLVRQLDAAIEQSPPPPSLTYRGLEYPQSDSYSRRMAEFDWFLANGIPFVNQAYSSTSRSPVRASYFSKAPDGELPIMMEIRLKKGLSVEKISEIPEEGEILARRNLRLQVVSIQRGVLINGVQRVLIQCQEL